MVTNAGRPPLADPLGPSAGDLHARPRGTVHVIADVLDAVIARTDPLVVDLGAGPGSPSARLLERFPRAELVAVDTDPLLLGLAEAAYGDRAGLRIVRQDLRATRLGRRTAVAAAPRRGRQHDGAALAVPPGTRRAVSAVRDLA